MKLSSPPARLARAAVNRIAGDDIRVVRVLSGVARGKRLALDLSKEKAYWLGHYERPLQEFLRENVHPGDVVYDVGAHVGFLSVCAASRGARVVAVEPDPANAARLRRNAGLNGLDIAVVEAAAWHESGRVELVPGASAKEFHVVTGEGWRASLSTTSRGSTALRTSSSSTSRAPRCTSSRARAASSPSRGRSSSASSTATRRARRCPRSWRDTG